MSISSILVGDALTEFEAGNDANCITILNTPSIQVLTTGVDGRPAGFSTVATMAADLGQAATAAFQVMVAGAADASEAGGDAFTARLIRAFLLRFETTQEGLDFANEELRTTLSTIITGAGADPAPYLALGYTLISPAQNLLSRDVVQTDLDLRRREIAVDDVKVLAQTGIEAAEAAMRAGDDPTTIIAAAKAEWV